MIGASTQKRTAKMKFLKKIARFFFPKRKKKGGKSKNKSERDNVYPLY
jgi:hypothetical protein